MTDSPPDIDELVGRLRARVEERRQQGHYPEGLEERLRGHFQRIVAHRPPPYDYDRLRSGLGHLEANMGFSPAEIATDSQMPGGSALHRTIAKLVSRQTAGVLEQVHHFAEAVRDLCAELVAAMEHPNSHSHAELMGQVDALYERLSEYERTPTEGVDTLAELSRRLHHLEEAERRRQFKPWYANDSFEESFRGTREEIRAGLADLADQLKGCDPVIDIGCGRGELLELLRDRGVEARGIEIDPALVDDCRQRGLDVEQGDAIGWLARANDTSLGGIVLIQVIEHLTQQEAVELVALAYDKLRPGGKAVVETVNPQSLLTFARAFYIDPTHTTPVHPAYLAFLFREAGFPNVDIEWRSPPPPDDPLEELPEDGELSATANRNVARLNGLLYGPQDYAVVAVR